MCFALLFLSLTTIIDISDRWMLCCLSTGCFASSLYIQRKFETCVSYPDGVNEDAYWQTAKAFSIIAPIWGTLSWCTILMARDNPTMAKVTGLLLMLATLFQGLTLMVFKSDLCDASENQLFAQAFPIRQATGTLTTDDRCNIGRSAGVSIAATCLWFIAGLVALVLPVDAGEA